MVLYKHESCKTRTAWTVFGSSLSGHWTMKNVVMKVNLIFVKYCNINLYLLIFNK